jgi:tRNA threonylcarbamoyladenosine biosynthesis protein TsaE|tara:strand:+ start:152 stop:658 length:507 start_codon:yes stop_codon:yes gene_type:complete
MGALYGEMIPSQSISDLKLISHSPEQTQQLGVKIGELALPGDIFLLVGNLGAGKTCLAQGIAWGLDIKEYALSPSFVIMRELHGRLPLYHIDLYRLDRIEEIADLGLDDYLHGNGVCVVEWAEKGLSALPTEHLMIQINYLSDTERSFQLKPSGKRYQEILAQLNDLS